VGPVRERLGVTQTPERAGVVGGAVGGVLGVVGGAVGGVLGVVGGAVGGVLGVVGGAVGGVPRGGGGVDGVVGGAVGGVVGGVVVGDEALSDGVEAGVAGEPPPPPPPQPMAPRSARQITPVRYDRSGCFFELVNCIPFKVEAKVVRLQTMRGFAGISRVTLLMLQFLLMPDLQGIGEKG